MSGAGAWDAMLEWEAKRAAEAGRPYPPEHPPVPGVLSCPEEGSSKC